MLQDTSMYLELNADFRNGGTVYIRQHTKFILDEYFLMGYTFACALAGKVLYAMKYRKLDIDINEQI